MKRPVKIALGVFAVLALIVIADAWFYRHAVEKRNTPQASTIVSKKEKGIVLKTTTDPVSVFKKAFWRRPAAEDKIVHAERREWSDPKDGVTKWQWFIEVEPGVAMVDWLGGNPFSLATNSSPKAATDFAPAPSWFPKSGSAFDVQQNAEGRFTLMISKDRKHLFATDNGYGFDAAGAHP